MTIKPRQVHSLILATDSVLFSLTDAVARILADVGLDSPASLLVRGVGEALRQMHACPPDAVFVCTSREQLQQGATLIDELHRRRPQITMLAVTSEHDERIEQSVRAAGATYYFPLESDQDEHQLRRALELIGIAQPAAPPGVKRVPPRPVVHRRQRARDGPRRTYQS